MSRYVRRNGRHVTGFGQVSEAKPDNIVEFPSGRPTETAPCSGGCGKNVILPRNYVAGIPVYCGPKGCRKSGHIPPSFAL